MKRKYTKDRVHKGQDRCVQEVELQCPAHTKKPGQRWKAWSCKDALWTLLLWLLLVVARDALSAWAVASDGEASFEDWGTWRTQRVQVPHVVTVQVMGVLVVASFWQVRTSHAMLLILNWWSANLLTGQVSCMEAKREWRGVSGLFRKTSRTFEHCFAALASLIVMLALCALYDLRQGLRVRNRTDPHKRL
ncbi:unnamed protein product [Cladocopium goreaui]|uniref:Uncharacterized protein n=1 Tax=Cladocopium goreaui TaxID=2562237 RepID=A0A9P1DGA5_9DINO|nr:unnamed protein product [Cladocopium goreaui]